MWQWDFLKPLQCVWNYNGNVGQGFPIIRHFTRQINCLCEGWGWQFVHPCTSSYFSCQQWYTFGTCSSLVGVVCLASKACQYACNDIKVFVGLKEVSLKATQSRLQKNNYMDWKVSQKVQRIWHRSCLDTRLSHWKLKTLMKIRFASKVIMFQETFKHCDAVNLCYGKQKIQNYKVMYQVHTHGQFMKWLLKLCFLLWNKV